MSAALTFISANYLYCVAAVLLVLIYVLHFEVVVSLDGDVIQGKFPPKKLRMVQTWIDIHKEELEANWKLLQNGNDCFKISPLR